MKSLIACLILVAATATTFAADGDVTVTLPGNSKPTVVYGKDSSGEARLQVLGAFPSYTILVYNYDARMSLTLEQSAGSVVDVSVTNNSTVDGMVILDAGDGNPTTVPLPPDTTHDMNDVAPGGIIDVCFADS